MPPRAQQRQAPGPAPRPRSSLVRSRIGLAIVALVLSRLIVFASWASQAFWPVSLPDFWARGAAPSSCRNLHALQVDASLYSDKPSTGIASKHQELSFCEDAEDIGGGWVLLSCDPNRGHWNTVMGPLRDPRPRGALWVRSTASIHGSSSSEPHLLPLSGFPPHADFHPLGTSYHEPSGRLFVVNHGRNASSIEVFTVTRGDESGVEGSGWAARYIRTLRHPLATHTPNSLVALSATSLLVTNDHLLARRPPTDVEHLRATYAQVGVAPSWLPAPTQARIVDVLTRLASHPLVANIAPRLETILGLSGGWVAQLRWTDDDGDDSSIDARVVARNIPFANGLALSPDYATLAVASTTSPAVRLYGLPAGTGTDGWLAPLGARRGVDFDEVAMPFTPDNLAFAVDERAPSSSSSAWRLTVAGHANPLQLLRLASNPYDDGERPASSWVVVVDTVLDDDEEAGAEDKDDREAPVPVTKRRTRVVAGRRQGHDSSTTPPRRYRVRTLYQGSSGDVGGAGVRSSTTGVLVARPGNGDGEATLVVPGLYARGVLVCKGISL